MNTAPSKKFLILYVLICIGSAYAARLSGGGMIVLYLILMVYAGIAMMDYLISRQMPNQLSISFPDMVRMSKKRKTTFYLTLINHTKKSGRLRLGLLFPNAQFDTEKTRAVQLTGKKTSIAWEITGLQHGQYINDACYVEIDSLFGLWKLRDKKNICCEFRVYPDILSEQKNMTARFLGIAGGVHAQRCVGKGQEFERLREYLPGDLYEDIYWKATARRGSPVTKIYQIEKTQDVYVMIDASRMSKRTIPNGCSSSPSIGNDETAIRILDKYILTALSLGLAAEKQGDKFGIVVFDDQVKTFIPAGNRKSHYTACMNTLYNIKTRPATPDFTELITFAGNRIHKRALLILLTSLDDPSLSDSLLNHIHILSRRHLMMVNMIAPADARPVFSSNQIQTTSDIYKNLGGHIIWHFLRELKQSFHRTGVGFFLHHPQKLTHQIIAEYIKIKQRQAL